MDKQNDTKMEDKLQDGKTSISGEIKKSIFDWIAAVIVLALIAVSLDVFGLIELNNINVLEFFIGWFPYFATSMLLNTDFYKKGVFVGKRSDKFINILKQYSDVANTITGKQIRGLYDFCENYNKNAIKAIQTEKLRKEGMSYEEFEYGYKDESKNVDIKPLKILSKKEMLYYGYTANQYSMVKKAKKVKVVGINVNILLSTMNIKDPTNIGSGEKVLARRHVLFSMTKYILSTLLMSIIAIKSISDWGWVGLILILFKVIYMFAGSYMSYFKGYDDATISLSNHFLRKTDILKMYISESSVNENET